MVTPASSRRNPRALPRWQDKMIACLWLPLNLLFDLWVYLTPAYEEKWDLESASSLPIRTHTPLIRSFLVVTLVVISVIGFALFALLTLPIMIARLLLILAFWISFRQFMRPRL